MGDSGRLTGQVKWFDATRGFGFIVGDGCESDILLHANVLRSYGRNSVAGNARIEVNYQTTDRGCQATEIISIEAPDPSSVLENLESILGKDVVKDPQAELVAARVKWFDRTKGFGFVNVFGSQEDVFVHMEILHACGLAELEPGEAICIRLASGPRGRMAWDVHVWDHAIGEEV